MSCQMRNCSEKKQSKINRDQASQELLYHFVWYTGNASATGCHLNKYQKVAGEW